MINGASEYLSSLVAGGGVFAPLLALLAGVLVSFMPCSLSTVPLVIGYVGGTAGKDTRRSFRLSLVFAAGMAVTFTALGTAAAVIGRMLLVTGKWWYLVLGVLMVLMALQTWGIFSFIPATHLTARNTKRGYLGALLTGMLGGLFSSPCATPVLVVLLGIVAGGGSLAWGILLLLCYSAGHSVLVVLVGTGFGFVQKLKANPAYGRISQILNLLLGAGILAVALYMFYLGF